jgi:hypothetical protein
MQEMLLIDEHSVFKLYQELATITGYFIAPVFTIALIMEYFTEMRFGEVVKKLLLITIFISAFYGFHTEATKVSLEAATQTLKKVSPNNLFIKKWTETKLRTKKKDSWSVVEAFAIPNLNDFVATSFFVLSKIFIWLLKLIYSSVYHLTYVFSGFTALLYFLGWTKDALKGTVQASLWCIIMPFVVVAILSLVGNSFDQTAMQSGVIVGKVDNIIWLFGVTLLLLITPMIAFGMIRGDGIHAFGSQMGSMMVSSAFKSVAIVTMLSKLKNLMGYKTLQRSSNFHKSGNSFNRNQSKTSNFQKNQKSNQLNNKNAHKGHKITNSRDEEQKLNKQDKKAIFKSNPSSPSFKPTSNIAQKLRPERTKTNNKVNQLKVHYKMAPSVIDRLRTNSKSEKHKNDRITKVPNVKMNSTPPKINKKPPIRRTDNELR